MKLLAFLLFLTLPASAAPTQISTNQIAPGAVTDSRVTLSTGGVTLGKFDDDKVAITTGGIKGGFSGANQLVKMNSGGNLVLPANASISVSGSGNISVAGSGNFSGNGASLTGIPESGVTGLLTDLSSIGTSTTSIASSTTSLGVAVSTTGWAVTHISTNNFSSGFNGANQLVQLNGSSQLPAVDGSALTGISGTLSGGLTGALGYWTAATTMGNSAFTQGTSSVTLDAVHQQIDMSSLAVRGLATFNTSGSTQAVFKGFSADGGASANGGMLALGNPASVSSGRMQYDQLTGNFNIENIDAAKVQLCVAAGTTRLCPMFVTGTGINSFNHATSTQGLFYGFSPDGGAAANSGMLKLGQAASTGLRLQHNASNGDVLIENMDVANIKMCTNASLASAGGRVCSFSMAGSGIMTISSQTLFTDNRSTQAVFKGYSAENAANASAGMVEIGNGLRLQYDNGSSAAFIENLDTQPIKLCVNGNLQSAGGRVCSLTMAGTGIVTFSSRTAFTNATSTQATFSGFSRYNGVSTNEGLIQIGGASLQGFIDYSSEGAGGVMRIGNRVDDSTARTDFVTRPGGTNPQTPISIAGTGVVTFNVTNSTAAIFKGYSVVGGASANSGMIKLSQSDGVGLRLQSSNGSGAWIEQMDTDSLNLCTNASALRPCPVSIAGTGLVSISSKTTFNVLGSTAVLVEGHSHYSGNSTQSGILVLGSDQANNGALDYDAIAETLHINNTWDNATSAIKFGVRTSGTELTPMSIAGSGIVTFSSTTKFSDVHSTQAVFSGWSALGGASANSGLIQLGASNSLSGRLDYDNNSNGIFNIDNNYDNVAGTIKFGLRASGTRLTPLILDPTSGGLVLHYNTTSTQAVAYGFSSYSGASDNSGLIKLGLSGTTNSTLDFDNNGSDLHIDNNVDSATADIVFGTRRSGIPVQGLRVTGAGAVQVLNAGGGPATPFAVGSTTFVVTSNGLVGINIAPTFGLHVSTAAPYQAEFTGGTSYNGGTAGANNGSIILGNASGSRASLEYIHGAGDTNGAIHINDEYGSTAARIRLRANSTQVGVTTLTWTGGGRLGLGVDSPAATLHIGPNVGNPDATVFEIGVSTLIVNSKGLVGINVSDPLFALHASSAGPYQAEFTGGSPQGGASANNGSIILGNASGSRSHIDYSYTGEDSNGVMTIANEYGDTSARLRFKMNSNVVGQSTITFLGTGRLGINTDSPSADLHIAAFQGAGRTPNATAFQIGATTFSVTSNAHVGINATPSTLALVQATLTSSTQAVFSGWAPNGGNDGFTGAIAVGNPTSLVNQGLLYLDANRDLNLENTINYSNGGINFYVNDAGPSGGGRVKPFYITGVGIPTFNNTSSSQATFTGWAPYANTDANTGAIQIGGTSNVGLQLSDDGNRVAHVDNIYDNAGTRIDFGMRTAAGGGATPLTPLRIVGDGSVQVGFANSGIPTATPFQIGSTFTFTSNGTANIGNGVAKSTQAIFSGWSVYGGGGGQAANNGSILIGSKARLDYDNSGNGDFIIDNLTNGTAASVQVKVGDNGGARRVALKVTGDGAVTVLPNAGAATTTPFAIGSTFAFSSNGLLTINTAISTQAVFEGYSTISGASTNHGHIQIGAANTFSGHLDHGIGSTFRIYETDTSGNIQIGLGEPGLATSYPSIKIAPNSGTVQILPSAGGPSTSFQIGTSSLVMTSNNQLGLGITTPGAMLVIKATSSTNSQIMEWQKSNGVVFMRSFSDNGLAARSSSASFHVSDQTYGTDTTVNGAKIGSKVAVISGYADNGIAGYGDELALLSVQAFAFGGSQPTGRLFEVKGTTSADVTSRSDNFFVRSRGDVMIGDFTNGIDSYGRLGINRAKNTALTDTVHIGGRQDVNPFVIGSAASDDVTVDTMTVSANGVVSAPFQPRAILEGTSDTVYVGGNVTPIFWTTNRSSTGGLWGGVASSSTFTAPVAGTYQMVCQIEYAASAPAQVRSRIVASGLTYETSIVTSLVAASDVVNTMVVRMAANDTAVCNAYSPSNQTVVTGGTRVSMVKLW